MAKSIYDRVRATLAAADKARKAADYAAGTSARRSMAARQSAAVRRDMRDESILRGDCEPRTAREFALVDRATYGDFE